MSEPQTQYAYFQGRIVPISEATVPITTQSLHYGTGVFGGMRAYWNAEHEEAYIFRPYEHFERLLQSAALLRIYSAMVSAPERCASKAFLTMHAILSFRTSSVSL